MHARLCMHTYTAIQSILKVSGMHNIMPDSGNKLNDIITYMHVHRGFILNLNEWQRAPSHFKGISFKNS